MLVVVTSCIERFVALRTLFFVAFDLFALVLGELVKAQSIFAPVIFLALIAFVSFLFMNITNVLWQTVLSPKSF